MSFASRRRRSAASRAGGAPGPVTLAWVASSGRAAFGRYPRWLGYLVVGSRAAHGAAVACECEVAQAFASALGLAAEMAGVGAHEVALDFASVTMVPGVVRAAMGDHQKLIEVVQPGVPGSRVF